MSLETPSKIRTLQRKLYRKAKDEPDYRFYLLYDKVYREDILAHAYELAKARRGAPGVDGQTFEGVEAQGLEKWLTELRNELRTKRYKPQPVRRVMIPHRVLMLSVARCIVDRDVLRLIKAWLKAPVEERDEKGNRRMTGGQSSTRGTPQGGVVSPLLANLYMNRFLKYWRITERGRALGAQVVNYADDFVIVTRRQAAEARDWTRQVMTRLGLTLNEAKTKLKEARQESFDFLGYTFGPQHYRKTGREYLGASPSKKSLARLRQKVNGVLASDNPETWPEERDRLNRILRGWSNYFSYGTRWAAYGAVNHHVAVRVRHFLKRRQKVSTRGTRILTDQVLCGPLGVLRLRPAPAAARP